MLLQQIIELLFLPFDVDDGEVNVLARGANIKVEYSFEYMSEKIFPLYVGDSLVVIMGPLLGFLDI